MRRRWPPRITARCSSVRACSWSAELSPWWRFHRRSRRSVRTSSSPSHLTPVRRTCTAPSLVLPCNRDVPGPDRIGCMSSGLTNWSGNVAFGAPRVHRPGSVEELQQIVASAEHVRALGTAHSFNPIADTSGELVMVTELPTVIELSPDRSSVTVSAGTRYAAVAAALQAEGLALHNLGSLPHISVGGACATGTHGSGRENGNLATAVSALQLVRPTGELESLRRGDPDFPGSVVALGAVGIVTGVTLDVEPSYDVRQYVYEGLPLEHFAGHLNEVLDSAYSVSVFTDWSDVSRDNQIWVKQKVFDDLTVVPTMWHGAT